MLRETPAPDMCAHPNTRCVRLACERLGLPHSAHDAFGNFISIDLPQPLYFANASTPFNSSSVDKICKDKEFSWKLLHDAVPMPRTQGYFDPFPSDDRYAEYVTLQSYEAIADSVCEEFPLPVIIKMNAGQKGKNVFLCSDRMQVIDALTRIFDHASPSHDYVAIAQEYIEPKTEYRAIVFRGDIVLAYEKDSSTATFVGNLSPLHYENAKARMLRNEGAEAELLARLQKTIDPLFPILGLEFGGIDIILGKDRTLQIIELNTHPGFSYFVRDNGDEPLIDMYQEILRRVAS
jgi:glutathione synthase/RimK-type ligase-like ATP-grasp enzyme